MPWDPTVQQTAEADTLWMPDLTSIASLNADGGWVEYPQHGAPDDNAAGYSFEAGPFPGTHAIRPLGTASPSRFFYVNADIISGDQFTIEFFAKHPTLNWQAVASKTLWEIRTGQLIMPFQFGSAGAGISVGWEIWPNTTGKISRQLTISNANLNIAANTWASVAIVKYTNDTARVYINGVDVGGVSTFDIPQVLSDDMSNQGIRFGGTDGGASGFTISESLRISRTARTPGQTPTLKSLTGALTVDTADVAGSVPDGFLGALHLPDVDGYTDEEVGAVIEHVRTDSFMNATPMKAGGPDATRPTAGASGLYSYDWQLVDRTLERISDLGARALVNVSSTPQLLGGSGAPASGADLAGVVVESTGFNTAVPNDMSAWATIVGDLAAHIATLDVDVFAYSFWNEPDGGFWTGTRAQFMDFYEATADAIRANDPTTPIIGAEIVGIRGNLTTWLRDLIAKHVTTGCPLDGITFHDYYGDITYPEEARRLLDQESVAQGLAAGDLPLYVTEFNWTIRRMPSGASDDPLEDFTHLKAFGAAFTTAYTIRLLNTADTADVRCLSYSHITYGDPRDKGFAMTQMIGPNLEHWGPYNALKGLQMVLGDQRLTLTADLPPGVHAYAGRDSVTGRVGIALANYGWANQDARTVDINIDGLTGAKRVTRYLVDPTHSSRWDTFEDDPAGSVDQELEQTASANEDPAALSVTVPRSGSVFLMVETPRLPKLVKIGGTPVLLPS